MINLLFNNPVDENYKSGFFVQFSFSITHITNLIWSAKYTLVHSRRDLFELWFIDLFLFDWRLNLWLLLFFYFRFVNLTFYNFLFNLLFFRLRFRQFDFILFLLHFWKLIINGTFNFNFCFRFFTENSAFNNFRFMFQLNFNFLFFFSCFFKFLIWKNWVDWDVNNLRILHNLWFLGWLVFFFLSDFSYWHLK